MTQLSLGALGGVVLAPDALDEQRGAWCSPPEYTEAAGPFDLDPFTNPRSSLVSTFTCMLERGDDGFGLDKRDRPGTFFVKPDGGGRLPLYYTTLDAADEQRGYGHVHENSTVWIQPPYDIVQEALDHYGHTRYTALLRLDTSTKWFAWLWEHSQIIMVPKRDRLEFVPPPGVKASSNPFPHGLYYKRADDVPAAIVKLCYPWPCPLYPYADDPLDLRGAWWGA